MMKKLCCIFNIPSLYRESIYLNIDRRYDCEWYFNNEETDIALFDIKQLKSTYVVKYKKVLGRMYRMKGLIKRVGNREDFEAYLMVGAPMCISIWLLCILLRIVHPKKKIYFWTHGWYGKESKVETIIKKGFLRLADELFLYGNYAKSLLCKQGFNAEKMHVIHNSLSYDVQYVMRNTMSTSSIFINHFGNTNPTIIFIGRLTPEKQINILLESIQILKQRGTFVNLVLVGDGSEREILAQTAIAMGLKNSVWFYGACYDEKTNAELIYNADICVSPGNIGLTAMHCLMFGCPVITHNDFAYQMPEFEAIIPGENGAFFKRGQSESLADVLVEWFQKNGINREAVRHSCFKVIDTSWNPHYQMQILKQVLG